MRRMLICFAAALAVLVMPTAASAATIVVTSTASGPSGTLCTLREAINSANNDIGFAQCAAGSGADRIEFALPNPSTITLASELPEIKGNLEIAGPGAGALTVSGNNAVRPFLVGGPNTKISGLTITEGKSTFAGGILVNSSGQLELRQVLVARNEAVGSGGTNVFADGGGIYTQGLLKLVESTVEENLAKGSGASSQNGAAGGGINVANSAAELVLERSSVRNNSAIASSAGAGTTNANGGGITDFGKVVIIGSTISGNLVAGNGSSSSNSASGGGLNTVNSASVKVTIERSTITENVASASASGAGSVSPGGGGVVVFGPSFSISSSTIAGNQAGFGANLNVFSTGATVRNTIIAKPVGSASCTGQPLTSLGFNLEETTVCGLNTATDQRGVNPLLGPLGSYGGPTETVALQPGSPALDRGISLAGEADQRGFSRPVEIAQLPNAAGGNGADVGAYELQVPLAEITRGPAEGETIADAEPSFDFRSGELGATFICALDGAAAPCASPFKAPRLADGAHTFAVTAVSVPGYSTPIATSRSFTVDTRRTEPTKPVEPPKAPPVPKAPRSKILNLPGTTTKTQLSIRFSANVSGSNFSCKLDKRKWRPCRSPYKTPRLKLGKHVFKLRATGPTGLADPTPAVKKFKVVAPSRH